MSRADDDETRLAAEQETALLEALEAALRPRELDPQLNARLVAAALDDPLAEPTPEELVEAAHLRDALERGTPHDDAELLGAMRLAAPPSVDPGSLERAVQAALGRKRRSRVIYGAFGATSALLAAAAVVLLLTGTLGPQAPAATTAYARSRSTAPLFSEPFATEGTTARMDRIASARSRDLRDNRYASWGVR